MQKNKLENKASLKDKYFSDYDLLDKITAELKSKINSVENSTIPDHINNFASLQKIFEDYQNAIQIVKKDRSLLGNS